MPISRKILEKKSIWGLLPHAIQQSLTEKEPILSKILISRLCSDSRQVQPGDLFFAMPGSLTDGSQYIRQAKEKGAVIVIAENIELSHSIYEPENQVIYFPLISPWIGIIAAEFYSWPSLKMKMVAITGTNGKTTTSYICASLGEKLGLKTAIMGTNGYGSLHHIKPQQLTTPDPIRLQAQLAELRDEGVELVAIEISSHSLVQYRVNGCFFNVALFTNISRDHLDYHGDIDSYALAKANLMSWCNLSAVVINADDDYAPLFQRFSSTQEQWFYSFNPDFDDEKFKRNRMCILQQSVGNAIEKSLHVTLDGHEYQFPTNLVGRFNDQNLTGALLAFVALGYSIEQLQLLTANLFIPQGRMQTVNPDYELRQQPRVVVDFAHTPDAMDLVLKELKRITQQQRGNLVVVFGCGGDRDRGKRPLMASIAEQYGDLIIVTQDNPRHEDNEQIFSDIYSGFSQELLHEQDQYLFRCDDRRNAITTAIQNAHSQDIIAVLGKGHEKYQEIAGQRSAFDDVEIALQALSIQ